MIGKFLKNNWVITVIGGVLSVLLLRLFDSFFINDFLWDGIKSGFNAVIAFFNTEYSVKLYILVLLPILVIAAIIGVGILMSSIKTGKSAISPYPEWKDYTKDVFGDLQYRWQYHFYGNNYRIDNLQRYCNQCSSPLVSLRCPVCHTDYEYGHQLKSHEEIQALIQHRIDNGLYKNSRYFKA